MNRCKLLLVIFTQTFGKITLNINNEKIEIESIWNRNKTQRNLTGRYFGDDYENFRACVYDKQQQLCCSDNVDQVAMWRSQVTQEIYDEFARKTNVTSRSGRYRCRDYFTAEYCDVQGHTIHTFNFDCPPGMLNSEDHYCLTGKEGEECCTGDFDEFSIWMSKGCVENCPKTDNPADRDAYDDSLFFKNVQYGFCCSEDCKLGFFDAMKNFPHWLWGVIAGACVGIYHCLKHCCCKKKTPPPAPPTPQPPQPMVVQQPAYQPVYQQVPMAGSVPGQTIVINNNMSPR